MSSFDDIVAIVEFHRRRWKPFPSFDIVDEIVKCGSVKYFPRRVPTESLSSLVG